MYELGGGFHRDARDGGDDVGKGDHRHPSEGGSSRTILSSSFEAAVEVPSRSSWRYHSLRRMRKWRWRVAVESIVGWAEKTSGSFWLAQAHVQGSAEWCQVAALGEVDIL